MADAPQPPAQRRWSHFSTPGFRRGRKSESGHPVPDRVRDLVTLVVGEFCGTFMFLLLSFISAQTALETNDPGTVGPPLRAYSLMYIAAGFGTALAINVWIFYRVTGGMFNPAITVGLMLVGAVTPLRGLLIIPTQFVAGIAAAAVTDGLLPGPLLVGNSLSPGVSTARGLFLEMFLTAQLVLAVYFLAVEKHRATFLAPIGIGIAIFVCHICGVNYTGTGVNPARSFGPAVIVGFPGYHWIYWLGPLLGALLSFAVYKLFTWLEYWTANPGQDADDVEKASGYSRSTRVNSASYSDSYNGKMSGAGVMPSSPHPEGRAGDERGLPGPSSPTDMGSTSAP